MSQDNIKLLDFLDEIDSRNTGVEHDRRVLISGKTQGCEIHTL